MTGSEAMSYLTIIHINSSKAEKFRATLQQESRNGEKEK